MGEVIKGVQTVILFKDPLQGAEGVVPPYRYIAFLF